MYRQTQIAITLYWYFKEDLEHVINVYLMRFKYEGGLKSSLEHKTHHMQIDLK